MQGTTDITSELRAPAREQRQPLPHRQRLEMAWPYIRGGLLSVSCIWAFVVAYLTFTPRTYISRWMLNVPTATSNVSISLESIGQSNSSPNSPFGSSSLSPKVVYKEIAEGEKVRSAAARSLKLTLIEFGKPRVKLVDETALMMFEVTARSPESAKQRSDALIAAFNTELDRLRSDELEMRASAVRGNLAGYQAQVRLVREQTVRAHTETGLVSINQFNEMVTSLTNLRRRWVELGSEVDKLTDEQQRLGERLGVTPADAGRALKLASDPAILKALGDYTEAVSLFVTDNERFGTRHPQRMASANKRDAAQSRIKNLIERVAPSRGKTIDVEDLLTITSGSSRADLYTTLVRNDANIEGRRRELATVTADKARLESDVARLSTAAARLEDLKKDQLVADAVLSSAMARLDSSKSDIYGSYPIVQVVAQPDINEAASQPRPLYAAIGGFSGTLFACLAWMLAWLQFYHRSTHRKND